MREGGDNIQKRFNTQTIKHSSLNLAEAQVFAPDDECIF